MKIAVVSSNGKVGKNVVKEALERGLEVVAIAKGENKSESKEFLNKDLFDLKKEDLIGLDAVVDAFGVWEESKLELYSKSAQKLADLLSDTETRLIVVGGAGSLYMDKNHETQLMDLNDFPKEYLPVAKAHNDLLNELRKRNDVKWTYISPSADFIPDGEKTGKYKLAGEEFTVNSKGESIISYSDYAVALVDEIINGNHIKERISVIGE